MSKEVSRYQKRAAIRYIGLINDISRLAEQLEKKNYPEYKKLEPSLTMFVNQLNGVQMQNFAVIHKLEHALGKRPPPSLPPTHHGGGRVLRFTFHPTKRRPKGSR